MRNKYINILFYVVIVAITVVITALSSGRDGPYSGSPGDNGVTCNICHIAGPVQTISNAVTTNIPSSGYVPGDTYTITLTITHPTNNTFGFQVTAENSSNAKVGTFVSTNNSTQAVNGATRATHTIAGNSGTNNSRTWTVNWIAPAAGTGDVTFYAAFNASNGSNGNQTISTSNTTVSEDPPAIPLNLTVTVVDESCPGACDGELIPTASGGEGPPYNFTITGGSNTNLCPGSYTVTAYDSQNNSTQTTVQVASGVLVTKPAIIQDWDRVVASSPDAASYRWYVDGVIIPNADSSWVFITQNGFYQAVALSSTFCEEPSDSLMITNFSVEKQSAGYLKLYPNPGSNRIQWEAPEVVTSVTITDMGGKKVLHKDVSGRNHLEVPEYLAAGRYIVQLNFDNGHVISKPWSKK
jgi:hypothetical protein